MIQKTLKTETGKLQLSIPSVINEINLGQMMVLQERPEVNDLEAISILSGVPLQQLQNVKNFGDLLAFGETILSLSQQIKYLYNSDTIPKSVIFKLAEGDKTINVLQNLSIEPAGAFMAAREIIAEEINEHIKNNGTDGWEASFNPSLKACSQVLAHYFYCRVTGKMYNEYEAEEFCNEIKKLRVTEALPIAKHFFYCYPGLLKPKTGFFHRLRQLLKKKRASKHSKNSNISTL